MSDLAPASLKSSLLYTGWIVASFLLGGWVGHFGFKHPAHQPQKRALVPSLPSSPAVRRPKVRVPARRVKARKPAAVTVRKTKAPTSKPASSVQKKWLTAADLPGIAFDRLDPARRKRALAMMNALKFPCGCGQTVARCARENLACSRVQRIIEVLMEAVHGGKTKKEIIDAIYSAAKPQPTAQPQQPQQQQGPPSPKSGVTYKIPLGAAPVDGPKGAKLTVVIFSDFECPYCAQAKKQVELLREKFGAKNVRVSYRHLPLPFHHKAPLAAEAAMAAGAQGKFWAYHDKLFANQEKLGKEDLIRYAKELKLDVKRFTKELNEHKYKTLVDKDSQFASQMNIPGTPFFFINGIPVGENDTSLSVASKALKQAEALLKKGIKPENLYAALIKDGAKKP